MSWLTPPVLCISESCIEIKINLNFYFKLLCDAPKDFMVFNAFIKPFEAPQRSVKNENLSFFFLPGIGVLRIKPFSLTLPCLTYQIHKKINSLRHSSLWQFPQTKFQRTDSSMLIKLSTTNFTFNRFTENFFMILNKLLTF